MTIATTQATGYSRVIPLNDTEEYQVCHEMEIGDVPEVSTAAVVGNVTPRSIRYDDGRQSWFVAPHDKTLIRAYRERRREQDIQAGAYPTLSLYFDNKGPL